jgi:hypothetical protein
VVEEGLLEARLETTVTRPTAALGLDRLDRPVRPTGSTDGLDRRARPTGSTDGLDRRARRATSTDRERQMVWCSPGSLKKERWTRTGATSGRTYDGTGSDAASHRAR